jgi:hypothetical protein
MNKKLYFILYPLVALLAVFYTSHETLVAAFHKTNPASGFNFSSARKSAARTHSVVLSKDSRDRSKNKIRIKANDDCAAVGIPAEVRIRPLVIYPSAVAYSDFRTVFFAGIRSVYRLRGPPSA